MPDTPLSIAQPFTKSTPARLKAMASALMEIDRTEVPGDVVECGVWHGGNIILARLLSPKRRCWLFDTFEGMTPPGPEDGPKAHSKYEGKTRGGHKMSAVSLATVETNLARTKTYHPDLTRFVVGPVEQTLRMMHQPEEVALLRLDTDWYESTKVELQVLWPKLQKGGFLIVDDYGHWPGARRAVDEYFGGPPDHVKIDYTCILILKT